MKDKEWYDEYQKKVQEKYNKVEIQLKEAGKRLSECKDRLEEVHEDELEIEAPNGWCTYIYVNKRILNEEDEMLSDVQRNYKKVLEEYIEIAKQELVIREEFEDSQFKMKNDKFFEDIQNEDVKVIYLTDGSLRQVYYDMIIAAKIDEKDVRNVEIIGDIPLPVYIKLGGKIQRINGICDRDQSTDYKTNIASYGVRDWTAEDAILAGYDEKIKELGGWNLKNSLFANDYDAVMARINDPEISDSEILSAEWLLGHTGYSDCEEFFGMYPEILEKLESMLEIVKQHEIHGTDEVLAGVKEVTSSEVDEVMRTFTKEQERLEQIENGQTREEGPCVNK